MVTFPGGIVDGDVLYVVSVGAAVSADPAYSGVDPSDLVFLNQDDDAASIIVNAPQPALTTTESGGSDFFEVVLSSKPAANVTAISSARRLNWNQRRLGFGGWSVMVSG